MFFIPIAVAVLAVIATLWYGFVWVPSQTTYFKERYLRQLAIMENQIKRKMEGFDSVMDNVAGAEFLTSRSGKKREKDEEIRRFFDYLNVGIHSLREDEVDEDVKNAAHDPPSVQVLSGHFKIGQRWSPQNRPTGLTQDRNPFYLAAVAIRVGLDQKNAPRMPPGGRSDRGTTVSTPRKITENGLNALTWVTSENLSNRFC